MTFETVFHWPELTLLGWLASEPQGFNCLGFFWGGVVLFFCICFGFACFLFSKVGSVDQTQALMLVW